MTTGFILLLYTFIAFHLLCLKLRYLYKMFSFLLVCFQNKLLSLLCLLCVDVPSSLVLGISLMQLRAVCVSQSPPGSFLHAIVCVCWSCFGSGSRRSCNMCTWRKRSCVCKFNTWTFFLPCQVILNSPMPSQGQTCSNIYLMECGCDTRLLIKRI